MARWPFDSDSKSLYFECIVYEDMSSPLYFEEQGYTNAFLFGYCGIRLLRLVR